jgi:hypothetical protein
MDPWRQKQLQQIVPDAQKKAQELAAATQLEIALGHARSEIAYALELARANNNQGGRVAAGGQVYGDEVWMSLGEHRLSFLFNRRELHIDVVIPGQAPTTITFDGQKLVMSGGTPVDMHAFVRAAIDTTVSLWKSPRQLPNT